MKIVSLCPSLTELVFALERGTDPDLAIEIDWRSVALTFGLALAAGLLFGLSPALHATRLALRGLMADGFDAAVFAAVSRHGASRVGLALGTSAATIAASTSVSDIALGM